MEVWKKSDWENLQDLTYTETIKHSGIKHFRATVLSAMSIAKIFKEIHGLDVNIDYLIAGALLHDVSKLVEDSSQGGKSILGQKIPHAAYAVGAAIAQDLPIEVVHIIASHTRYLRKMPETLEALIVRHIDELEADCHALMAGEKLFSSRVI
jgi:putative nucleotidyltransferase with HDIG domain